VSSIKAITFDLDHTLWDTTETIIKAEAILYQWLSDNAPKVTAKFSSEDLIAQRRMLLVSRPELAHQVSALRKISLFNTFFSVGYSQPDAEELTGKAFEIFYLARQKVTPFSDVVPTLEKLKQRFLLGSITNGNANLEIIGLSKYFAFSLSAEISGANKPSIVIYQQALQLAGCRQDEIIHVGDHPSDDIFGAKECGFHTIWVNYFNSTWQEDYVPSAEINSFKDILTAIDRIEAGIRSQY